LSRKHDQALSSRGAIMNGSRFEEPAHIARRLRAILLELARHEEELAMGIAAQAPYWQPRPTTALGHSAAAAALRTEANRFEYAVALPSV
jgi:hypothetical protein